MTTNELFSSSSSSSSSSEEDWGEQSTAEQESPTTTTVNPTNVSCKYGTKCISKLCSFKHPDRQTCRNNNDCVQKGCWYNHDTKICIFGDRCVKGSDCQFRHVIKRVRRDRRDPRTMCRFAGKCVNSRCTFIHLVSVTPRIPSRNPLERVSLENVRNPHPLQFRNIGQKENLKPKLISQTPCKFGLKCYKEGCKYLHPPGKRPIAIKRCRIGQKCDDPHCIFRLPMTNCTSPPTAMIPVKCCPSKPSPKEMQEREDEDFKVVFNSKDVEQSETETIPVKDIECGEPFTSDAEVTKVSNDFGEITDPSLEDKMEGFHPFRNPLQAVNRMVKQYLPMPRRLLRIRNQNF